MDPANQSVVSRSLRVAAWLTSPLLALSGLFCCNSVNPMQVVFVTEMVIVNKSREDIVVSPIGEAHGSGRLRALPTFLADMPAIMAPRDGRFPVASGTTLRLFYDFDDIAATQIIVETVAASPRELAIGSAHGPYVVEQIDELPEASESARTAAGGSVLGSFLLFYFGWAIPILLFVGARVARADK